MLDVFLVLPSKGSGSGGYFLDESIFYLFSEDIPRILVIRGDDGSFLNWRFWEQKPPELIASANK